MEIRMLWFGVTIVDVEDGNSFREMHGPYSDADALGMAVDERVEEATLNNQQAFPMPFELCTDDVPEIVESFD